MVEANVWKLSNILTPSITEKFEIPRYQRGYAWESKQVEEFCEDLCKMLWDELQTIALPLYFDTGMQF